MEPTFTHFDTAILFFPEQKSNIEVSFQGNPHQISS